MVNLNTPFRKTFLISINSLSNTNIHVKKLFKVALTSVYLAKTVLNFENSDVVEYHWTKRRLRRVTIPCTLYLMIKWLTFSQPVKHLLFYFPYKHSLITIEIIALVSLRTFWQPFVFWINYIFSIEILVYFSENCSLNLLWFLFFPPQNYALISNWLLYIFSWKTTRNTCWDRGRNTWWEELCVQWGFKSKKYK